MCNRYRSFKTAIFDTLKTKNIEHKIFDGQFIFIRCEAEIPRIFSVLGIIAELLSIKINFRFKELNLEVIPSVRKLRLRDPVVIAQGEGDSSFEEEIRQKFQEMRRCKYIIKLPNYLFLRNKSEFKPKSFILKGKGYPGKEGKTKG